MKKKTTLFKILFCLVFSLNAQTQLYVDCTLTNNKNIVVDCKIKEFNEFNISEGFVILFDNKESKITPNAYLSFIVNNNKYESEQVSGVPLFLKVIEKGKIKLLSHNYLSINEASEDALIEENVQTDYYIKKDNMLFKIDSINFKELLLKITPNILITDNETYFDLPLIIERYNNG